MPRPALTKAVVIHLWGADAIPGRADLLSFALQDNTAALTFAKAEFACRSWRIARNRVLAACLVWSNDPWGGCGSSLWAVAGESKVAAGAAASRF